MIEPTRSAGPTGRPDVVRPLVALLCLALALSARAAPPVPDTPAGAQLLRARPFTLDTPAVAPGGGLADRGLVLVIHADAALTAVRQTAMPVLQLGGLVAAPASRGRDGVLVAVVLGDVDPGASVLFFGPPELPERVDAAAAWARADAARAAGVAPIGAPAFAAALSAGGAPLELATLADLAPALRLLRCEIEPDALAEAGTPCPEAR